MTDKVRIRRTNLNPYQNGGNSCIIYYESLTGAKRDLGLECLLNNRSGLMEQRYMFFDFLLKIIRADFACAKFKALMKAV